MKVNLTYFKRSGKYYSGGEFDAPDGLALYEIWELTRDMIGRGIRPGLVDGFSEFIISVDVPDHEHNHPHLIMP